MEKLRILLEYQHLGIVGLEGFVDELVVVEYHEGMMFHCFVTPYSNMDNHQGHHSKQLGMG